MQGTVIVGANRHRIRRLFQYISSLSRGYYPYVEEAEKLLNVAATLGMDRGGYARSDPWTKC
jgi:formate-dependent phosphoribosylglycinamide formyltransferase (GAR transformylase)